MFRPRKNLVTSLASTALNTQRAYSTGSAAAAQRLNPAFLGLAAGAGALILGAGALYSRPLNCSEDALNPPQYPWSHASPWQAYDHASIRRGHQVYKEVCAACHSLNLIAWRNLVDVCYTEDEVVAMAAETEVEDGPDEEGEMFTRPGKLTDFVPRPYANENQARAANAGSYPPDLTLMVKARPYGADYVFALLTGYRPAPAGISVREGLYYNPYFAGGMIGMPPPLNDGMLEYEDGTPATVSQMAKDVTTFLCWTSRPEHDERKAMGVKALTVTALLFFASWYVKRFKWSVLKTRKVQFPGKNLPTV